MIHLLQKTSFSVPSPMLQMIPNQMKLSLLPSATLPISFLLQFKTIFCEIPVLLYSTPAYQQLTPIFFLLLSVLSLPYVSFCRHSVLPMLYASYPHHLPCHTCPLMQQIFFRFGLTIPCLYMMSTTFYKIFLLLLGYHSFLHIWTK